MAHTESAENIADESQSKSLVSWNPWFGVAFILLIYFLSQFIGSLIVSIYPILKHMGENQANQWLNNSILAQFIYVLIAETIVVGSILWFLKWKHISPKVLGLRRPRWSDPLYGLAVAPAFYILYFIAAGVIHALIPGFDINQQQNIGFTNAHSAAQLIMTFISLAVLPPIAEEIMVRGFLYSSLKKALPRLAAVIVTSAIFASAHLPEGGAAGPLWIGAIDTFILSLFLIYLREKTKGIWASMTLHGINNTVAYVMLYVATLTRIRL